MNQAQQNALARAVKTLTALQAVSVHEVQPAPATSRKL